jgi:hypothetical protein
MRFKPLYIDKEQNQDSYRYYTTRVCYECLSYSDQIPFEANPYRQVQLYIYTKC